MVVSLTLPAVNSITRARPRPSVRACTLVVSPPRERPMAWSPGSSTAGLSTPTLPVASVLFFPPAPTALLIVVTPAAHGGGVTAHPPGGPPVPVSPQHT